MLTGESLRATWSRARKEPLWLARFGANVMLDLLSGEETHRTRLRMVKTRPLPFPPEAFAFIGIQLTRLSLARADRTGRRNLWLRTLDRLGLDFDS